MNNLKICFIFNCCCSSREEIIVIMSKVPDGIRSFKERDMGADGGHGSEITYNHLSHSRAHYLLAIEALRSELGYARTTDVAEMLEVSRGAASMALTKLKKRGWVKEDPNRFLLLTEEGKHITDLVVKNFDSLLAFFTDILSVPREDALRDACKMEHIITLDMGMRLRRLTQLIKSKPELHDQLKAVMEDLPKDTEKPSH